MMHGLQTMVAFAVMGMAPYAMANCFPIAQAPQGPAPLVSVAFQPVADTLGKA